jgi:hypothetical protein
MQKATKSGWLVLAVLALLTGIILVIREPLPHSRFYIYFLMAGVFFFLWYKKAGPAGKRIKRKRNSKKS